MRTVALRATVAMIGLVGVSYVVSVASSPFLARANVQLTVPRIVQSNATSCGEAAIVMAYDYAHPEKPPIDEKTVISYAKAQGLYTPDAPPFTSPASVTSIARNYAADASSGNVVSGDDGLRLLTQELQSDSPVIIDVTTSLDDHYSGAHFILVTGLAVDAAKGRTTVSYNNPLTGHAESAPWAGDEGIWNAWQNNGDPGGSGWWLAIPQSGPVLIP